MPRANMQSILKHREYVQSSDDHKNMSECARNERSWDNTRTSASSHKRVADTTFTGTSRQTGSRVVTTGVFSDAKTSH